ncbi:MAG: hypothetical protein HYZ53_28875 [Planctomycetes bacterium]|nr:hypothetical protein [Planctomycetota bacterium]
MKCPSCEFDNPTTEAFCRRCGEKIHYVRSEVEGSLLSKAEFRDANDLEEQMRSFLVIAIAAFLLSCTIKYTFGKSGWPKPVEVPSSGLTASYSTYRYYYTEPPVKAVLAPPAGN